MRLSRVAFTLSDGVKLWLDDERPAPDTTWFVAKTSAEACEFIETTLYLNLDFEEASLDHDLGGEDNGMIVVDFMAANNIWPRSITVHTANPPARDNMLRAIAAESPDSVDMNVLYW